MDDVWDIPSRDEQEILVLSEEAQATPATDDVRMEIVEADKGPYFIQSGRQAIVGSVHAVIGSGTQVVLGSDWGSRYVAKVKHGMRPFASRAAFVTTSVLHEGYYWMRRLLVEFRRDTNTEEWRIPVRLPLLRVHRPHRAGCTTKATASLTATTEARATFEFLGIQGGGGQGFSAEVSTKLSAGSYCKERVIPATLIVEHGATLVNGEAVAYGVRYRIVDIDRSDQKTRRVPPEIDLCGRAPSPTPQPQPQFWTSFDLTDVPCSDSDDDEEGGKLGSTGYVSVGLGAEIGSLALKLSVEMKRTMEWKFEMKTTLKGGAKYLRFPVSPSAEQLPFEICWSVLDEVGSNS
jgi:hypothetical protein